MGAISLLFYVQSTAERSLYVSGTQLECEVVTKTRDRQAGQLGFTSFPGLWERPGKTTRTQHSHGAGHPAGALQMLHPVPWCLPSPSLNAVERGLAV